VRIVVLLALLAACVSSAAPRPRPLTGGIAGLVRDHDSGDPVALAEIAVTVAGQPRPLQTHSSDRGLYDIQALRPGRYTLTAKFAGQPIEVTNIEVRAGEITMVDLVFTLGRPEPIKIDHGLPKEAVIERYRPKQLSPALALIEGTVNDTATRQRVPGAVVTAVYAPDETTHQTVSDEHGRYRFEPVAPGVYAVSAYYSISGRGQIEVRRSITVEGAEAVIVPLWIEMAR